MKLSENFDSKVTIIFPAKNEEGTIETAISIAKQSCFTPEILVVDAYSTDKTVELATKACNEIRIERSYWQSKSYITIMITHSSLVTVASDTGQYIGPDDLYISQNHCVEMLLEEAEKLFNSLAELFVREVKNEQLTNTETAASLPALPLEADKQDYNEQNAVPVKDDLKN